MGRHSPERPHADAWRLCCVSAALCSGSSAFPSALQGEAMRSSLSAFPWLRRVSIPGSGLQAGRAGIANPTTTTTAVMLNQTTQQVALVLSRLPCFDGLDGQGSSQADAAAAGLICIQTGSSWTVTGWITYRHYWLRRYVLKPSSPSSTLRPGQDGPSPWRS